MSVISQSAYRPLNRWNNDYISPGAVGSVGDALMAVQLKSTLPGDYREASYTKGNKECRFGSNVTDGFWTSYSTGAGPATVYDEAFEGYRDDKTAVGWEYQDLRATDRSETAILQATPQYTWRTKVAEVYRAQTPCGLFAIPKGGMIEPPKNGLTRGGMYPSVVASDAGARPSPISSVPSNIAPAPGSAIPFAFR